MKRRTLLTKEMAVLQSKGYYAMWQRWKQKFPKTIVKLAYFKPNLPSFWTFFLHTNQWCIDEKIDHAVTEEDNSSNDKNSFYYDW